MFEGKQRSIARTAPFTSYPADRYHQDITRKLQTAIEPSSDFFFTFIFYLFFLSGLETRQILEVINAANC